MKPIYLAPDEILYPDDGGYRLSLKANPWLYGGGQDIDPKPANPFLWLQNGEFIPGV